MDGEIQNVDHNAIPGEVIKTGDENTNNTGDTSGVAPSIEDRAREQGWRPKEDYEGDPSKWVSAETFVAKGELIDRIESLGKKLKESEKTIKMLADHNVKVKESEFKRAVEYLKSQKKAAYENGDVDKIIELDDKIAEVRETQKAQAAVVNAPSNEPHPDFTDWASDNKWYDRNNEMRADADTFGEAYLRNNPQKTPREVLEFVTTKIKKAYPEEFSNPNRNRPSGVDGGGGTRQAASRDNFSLTEEETKVMNTFVRKEIMTKDEYIAQVKATRGIK